MKEITPFLWFDTQAEEAARFYVSIFKNSSIDSISRYNAAGPGAPGNVMTVSFTLDGRPFTALNGGPIYKFTEAISFSVGCESEEEVDFLWEALSAGGAPGPCGWLKDRWGVSWQIVPTALMELLGDPDRAKAARVMAAMMKMSKLDIAGLRAAAAAA